MRVVTPIFLVLLLLSSGALAEESAAEASRREASFLFAVAQLYRFEGAYTDALGAFSSAVQADPEEPFLRLEFAEFLLQLGRLSEAAEHASAARSVVPDNRDALRLVGRIQLRLGERSEDALESAREAFEELRRLDPTDVEVRVTLGRLYLGRSRAAEAVSVLREARDLRPDDRLIVSLLVEAIESAGDDPAVIDELRALVARDPGFLQPRLVLAQVLGRNGDMAAAVGLLLEAPQEAFGNVEFLRQLSLAHYRVGELELSLDVGEKWLQKRPQDPMGRYLRALTLAGLGRDAESEDELEALLAENPDREDFVLALAEVIERQGRRDEAADLMQRFAARLESRQDVEGSRRITAMLVDLHARGGEWEEIIRLTDRMLTGQSPVDQDEFRLLRSQALKELGRGEEALAELDRLRNVPGLEERVAARRAEILFRLGRIDEAERSLASLSEAVTVEELMLAAEVLHGVGAFSRAIPVLRRAKEIEPQNLEVMFWLGASLERSGDRRGAESEFRHVLAVDADFAPALNYLGYMWAEDGENLDEALDLVRRAVELEPNNGAYLDSLGWAFFQSGRFSEARGHLERAAQLVGDDAVVLEHLGDLYLAVGDSPQADAVYRRALELGGDNAEAIRKKLDELGQQ
ncbi:MAG: tetratricopeptide repeat protein [Acidobacteriota bacterium]|nr:tetratricopeptide repeat protein [Acidobacteriota bacterium]